MIDVSLSGVLECQSRGPAAGEENWGEISRISRCISFVSRYISHISLYPAHIPLYPVVDIVKNPVQGRHGVRSPGGPDLHRSESVRRPRGGSGRVGRGLAVAHGRIGGGRSGDGASLMLRGPRTRVPAAPAVQHHIVLFAIVRDFKYGNGRRHAYFSVALCVSIIICDVQCKKPRAATLLCQPKSSLLPSNQSKKSKKTRLCVGTAAYWRSKTVGLRRLIAETVPWVYVPATKRARGTRGGGVTACQTSEKFEKTRLCVGTAAYWRSKTVGLRRLMAATVPWVYAQTIGGGAWVRFPACSARPGSQYVSKKGLGRVLGNRLRPGSNSWGAR